MFSFSPDAPDHLFLGHNMTTLDQDRGHPNVHLTGKSKWSI